MWAFDMFGSGVPARVLGLEYGTDRWTDVPSTALGHLRHILACGRPVVVAPLADDRGYLSVIERSSKMANQGGPVTAIAWYDKAGYGFFPPGKAQYEVEACSVSVSADESVGIRRWTSYMAVDNEGHRFVPSISELPAEKGEALGNVKHGWYGASPESATAFRKPNWALLGADRAHGRGLHLFLLRFPHLSMTIESNFNSVPFVLLSYTVQGLPMAIHAGSNQSYTRESGIKYVGALDMLSNLYCWVIWFDDVNSSTLPLCVMSIKKCPTIQDPGPLPPLVPVTNNKWKLHKETRRWSPSYTLQKLENLVDSDTVVESIKQGYQALVFVHTRKDTAKTARTLIDLAAKSGELKLFSSADHPQFSLINKKIDKAKSREVVEFSDSGFGIHNAGMMCSDRCSMGLLFADGLLKVLVCTATLAWGVNLPAHTVVIKGTQQYDAKAGGWRDLGMLDVMQIFGRAGRTQLHKSSEGIVITTHDKLAYYLRLLTSHLPIESQVLDVPNIVSLRKKIAILRQEAKNFNRSYSTAKSQSYAVNNTFVFSLSGGHDEVLKNYRSLVGWIRTWCRFHGQVVDISSLFGPGKEVFTAPVDGTIHLTVKHKNRSITLILAGRDLYIKGWKSKHGSFELKPSQESQYYMTDPNRTILPFEGSYTRMSGMIGKTRIGMYAFESAFEVLHKAEGKGSVQEKEAICIYVVNICEAARFQSIFNLVCESFTDFSISQLDSQGTNCQQTHSNSWWVTKWIHYSSQAMQQINQLLSGQKQVEIVNRGDGRITSVTEIVSQIRILLQNRNSTGVFAYHKMPPETSRESPPNAKGDCLTPLPSVLSEWNSEERNEDSESLMEIEKNPVQSSFSQFASGNTGIRSYSTLRNLYQTQVRRPQPAVKIMENPDQINECSSHFTMRCKWMQIEKKPVHYPFTNQFLFPGLGRRFYSNETQLTQPQRPMQNPPVQLHRSPLQRCLIRAASALSKMLRSVP